ncbi:sulfate permease [Amycolatopsis mediterranei S699]|uniref:Sulfate permease n=3 Tax=Amycolatopsis mediterranei TaxID=33910 RepID=A0A0H3D891_AMYMU|nr:SulP family inorganic anion transporter [Amycolatopsis mediterranei]ADJ47220.1 sulfate permease [Amycolatopsis mediterranei U32]AEK44043.1 sulfate permease [Amycolatopsis mediterranei S699]AFO78931.1 sulfate permease [Amycolatopsis mediterranei S699]AGT86059.1 sulfate permease [Amycolatopsis mediterranei RB]KDO04759.1 MFS transporter [Amycolatopsis mediterranei]
MSRLANTRELLPGRADYDLRAPVLRADLLAGLTVGVVALPLALAFGISSGAGAAAGLITAVVAGIVAAVFGGSPVQVSGPTGAMAVVLAPIVAVHGTASVALVSILGGVVVLVAGAARLGRLVGYLPWPVVEGFTLGIACIIFLQQIPAAVGTAAPAGRNPLPAAGAALAGAGGAVVGWTVATVAVVVATMLLLPKLHRGIPASLVAVAVATVAAEVTHAPVPRIGHLPSSLTPALPHFSFGVVHDLAGAVVAVAALAAIESLLSARVAATMTRGGPPVAPTRPDRELVGQGLASIVSGLFGGMPATGAIARTAVNVRSGARTRLAAIVHAVVILAVIYAATGLVSRIPLSALAGVLLVTSLRMVPPAAIREVVRASRSSAITFAVTALVTVAADLILAVEIGLLVAAFFALRHLAHAARARRDTLPGPAADGDEHIAVFRFEGAMFWGASERVAAEIAAAADDVLVVILRLSRLHILDATGAKALGETVEELEARGIAVLLKGVQDHHQHLLTTTGALRAGGHLFTSFDDAAAHARAHVRRVTAAPGQAR